MLANVNIWAIFCSIIQVFGSFSGKFEHFLAFQTLIIGWKK
jgi:hypothetical protein